MGVDMCVGREGVWEEDKTGIVMSELYKTSRKIMD